MSQNVDVQSKTYDPFPFFFSQKVRAQKHSSRNKQNLITGKANGGKPVRCSQLSHRSVQHYWFILGTTFFPTTNTIKSNEIRSSTVVYVVLIFCCCEFEYQYLEVFVWE